MFKTFTEIAILSGKGGTGKTTIAAAFAAIANDIVIADCDVDAPDMHILLQPKIIKSHEFCGSKVAHLDTEACMKCGLCETMCRFDAIHPPNVDPLMCEGCGVCAYVCPEQAIELRDRLSGYLYESSTRFGPMAHSRLLPGEGNSGKLVTEVRRLAMSLAGNHHKEKIILDGSPGIGCPVIATVTRVHLAVIVTEPTMSGIHDLRRILSLLQHLQVKAVVIVNKHDLNQKNTEQIEQFCKQQNVEVLGRIKFDPIVNSSMVAVKTISEFIPQHEITLSLNKMWKRITENLKELETEYSAHKVHRGCDLVVKT